MHKTTTDLIVPTGQRLTQGQLYLRLYHGRKDPDQDMDGWGFDGPVFGPLSAVVMTYLSTIRIHGVTPSEELWLDTTRDMVRWQGNYYGDFEIFNAAPNQYASGVGR